MTNINTTPAFLSGRILLDLSMLQSWLAVINTLIPLTTDVLNDQLVEVKAELTSLLATIPQANIDAGKCVTPISFVSDFKYALATVEYQLNGAVPKYNDYIDCVDQVDSVYGQYSVTYQTSNPNLLVIY